MKKMRGRKSHVTVPLGLQHCGDTFSEQADDNLVLGTTCCQEVQKTKKTSVSMTYSGWNRYFVGLGLQYLYFVEN
jgi:hypothetical protein